MKPHTEFILDYLTQTKPVYVPRRMVYLCNIDKDKHNVADWQGRSLHGEYQLINGPYIDHFMKAFRKENPTDRSAYLVIYSYYIPCCTGNPTVPSCARDLGKFSRAFSGGIVIGYDRVFEAARDPRKNTDEELAMGYMQQNLKCFQFTRDSNLEVMNMSPPTPPCYQTSGSSSGRKRPHSDALMAPCKKPRHRRSPRHQITLQSTLYNCFRQLPVTSCCTKRGHFRQHTATYAANHAVYFCTASSQLTGSLNSMSRDYLRHCLTKWVDTYIGGDCGLCSDGSVSMVAATRNLVMTCLEGAVSFSQVIGVTKGGNDVTKPVWSSPVYGMWTRAYSVNPEMAESRGHLTCGIAGLDPAGLCTMVIKDRHGDRSDGDRHGDRSDGDRHGDRGDGDRHGDRGDGDRHGDRGDGDRHGDRSDGDRYGDRSDYDTTGVRIRNRGAAYG